MRAISFLLALASTAAVVAHSAASPEPAALISNGEVTVTTIDFEAQMLRIPEENRREARASLERVASMTDTLFVNRMLAAEAARVGVPDDPLVRRREEQIVESYRARAYLDYYLRNAKLPPLDARAKELYAADRSRFRLPERYEVEHVLINLWGRTREMALERALEARAKILGGDEFLAIAKSYSDDPTFKNNGGKLGPRTLPELSPEIAKAVPTMKLGEISEPISSRSGFHIIRVVAKTPAKDRSFDEVKDELIESERGKLLRKMEEDKIESYRKHPNTRVNAEALKALVTPYSPQEMLLRREPLNLSK